METLNIFSSVLSLLLGGGATWLFTLKHARRQAEADAMLHFQTVYQGLIKDLQEDRTELRRENASLSETIKQIQGRLKELETTVSTNARILQQLSEFANEKAPACKGCVLIELIRNSLI